MHVDGLHEPHELEVMLDRERLELFQITLPRPARAINRSTRT